MYIPRAFAAAGEDDVAAAIAAHEFALLVSHGGDGLSGTHLPLMLDRGRGPRGTLIGHVARAAGHWRSFDGREVMASFSGPHAYVSPRWYAASPAVPTWNYVAVHCYGVARAVEDPAALRAILEALTRRYEGDGAWSIAGLPATFRDDMVGAIVGVEIEITRVDAKFKLSQNRSAEDRRRVVTALERSEAPGDRALAEAMASLAPAA